MSDQVQQGRDWWRLGAAVCLMVFVAALAVASGGMADQSVAAVAVISGIAALLMWLRRRH